MNWYLLETKVFKKLIKTNFMLDVCDRQAGSGGHVVALLLLLCAQWIDPSTIHWPTNIMDVRSEHRHLQPGAVYLPKLRLTLTFSAPLDYKNHYSST